MEQRPVTNEDLEKRLKRIQLSTDIQTAIIIMAFIGILTMGELLNRGNKIINGKN